MAIKLIYLARRAASGAREDWPRTWKSHAIFASQFPVLESRIEWMRYCNRIDRVDLPGVSSAHDGVAIAASDSLEGLNGAGFSDDDRALIDRDELRVFDMLTPNFTWYCEETQIQGEIAGEAAIFRFLMAKSDAGAEDFHARWDEIEDAPQSAIRHVHNRPLHDRLPLFPFSGIAESWFESEADAIAALKNPAPVDPARGLSDFCELGASVTMVTKVCHRWPKG